MRVSRAVVAAGLAAVLAVGGSIATSVNAAPRQDIQQVQRQVRDLQMQAEAATERANAAQLKLSKIESDLSSTRDKVSRQRDDLKVMNATLDDIARAIYARGGMDPALEVLMADDPEEFLAQAAVMGQLEQGQVNDLRRAQTARLRLAQTEAEITDREDLAQATRDEMAQAKSEADQQLAAAQDVLAGLQEEERRRLEQLAEQKRLQEIAEAQAAAKAAAAAAAAANANDSSGGNSDSGSGSGSTGGSGGGGGDSGASSAGGGFTGGSRAAAAIQYALAQVGDRYVAAGSGPDVFDCSGLTMMAWRQAGVSLAHLSYAQWDQTQRVPVSQIQPGDLVFYFGSGAHHVGMYVGNGKMVSASNPSDGVELIDYLGPWYGERFSGVGRVVG